MQTHGHGADSIYFIKVIFCCIFIVLSTQIFSIMNITYLPSHFQYIIDHTEIIKNNAVSSMEIEKEKLKKQHEEEKAEMNADIEFRDVMTKECEEKGKALWPKVHGAWW